MSDPFEKAKLIQRGEVEPESYDVIVQSIDKLPATMMPGLLARIVRNCVCKDVFADNTSMLVFVGRVARQREYLGQSECLRETNDHP